MSERISKQGYVCYPSLQHGMGNPSISILLHEIVKLVDHAGCKDVIFLRLGTSGGLGKLAHENTCRFCHEDVNCLKIFL